MSQNSKDIHIQMTSRALLLSRYLNQQLKCQKRNSLYINLELTILSFLFHRLKTLFIGKN
ncbi:CLUMA_CG014662, isoform A [Clunio marinus]|uniref:CLUMA_CG014662, isoform A n=1 Tax=Clunio marinus TaxID=568069 RepID=A0A1J1IPD3_9DIPT|nr:CLUMA_CG014662, isoform A [Clunio marinus]